VGAAVAKLPIESVIKALYPFFGALLVVLMAVTYVPALSMWLPGLLLK
jgi:TRAP-type C4-dicarboxylate transport system permease large subunit